MTTTKQQALLDTLTDEQLESFYKRREQTLYNKVAKEAEFWAGVEDITPQEVIDFHKNDLKRHQINRDRTAYLATKGKHSDSIMVLEGLLIVLQEAED